MRTSSNVFLALLCAASLIPFTAHAKQNTIIEKDVVGTVLEVEGNANINDGKSVTQAIVGSPIHTGDLISTGKASRLYVLLLDNTEFTLAENGQMEVNDYVYNPTDTADNHAVYSVMRGAFLYVSGMVAKKPTPDVKVNIPEGSIGIRGTRFWGGPLKGEYGVLVGDGEIEVKTKRGKVQLKRGEGTSIKKTIAGPTTTEAQAWTPEKIQAAVATVTLVNAGAIGERMKAEQVQNQPALLAEHIEVQKEIIADIKAQVVRTDPTLAQTITLQELRELRRDVILTPETPIREIIETNSLSLGKRTNLEETPAEPLNGKTTTTETKSITVDTPTTNATTTPASPLETVTKKIEGRMDGIRAVPMTGTRDTSARDTSTIAPATTLDKPDTTAVETTTTTVTETKNTTSTVLDGKTDTAAPVTEKLPDTKADAAPAEIKTETKVETKTETKVEAPVKVDSQRALLLERLRKRGLQ